MTAQPSQAISEGFTDSQTDEKLDALELVAAPDADGIAWMVSRNAVL
jgi:hypothetical protein